MYTRTFNHVDDRTCMNTHTDPRHTQTDTINHVNGIPRTIMSTAYLGGDPIGRDSGVSFIPAWPPP